MRKIKTASVLGVPFHILKKTQVLHLLNKEITQRVELGRKRYKKSQKEVNFWGQTERRDENNLAPFIMATPNPEMCVAAQDDSGFLDILNKTDLNIPDGNGILWATSYLNKKNPSRWGTLLRSAFDKKSISDVLPEVICGSDIFLDICEMAAKNNWKVFLLGAAEGVAAKCSEELQKRYPKINIVGTYSGSPKPDDDKSIRHLVRQTTPDLIFVAYGAPAQEKWIDRNVRFLPSVKFACGVGGTFDFVSGRIKRAPWVMRKLGLEWMWRLILQPSRWRRIYTAVVVFSGLVKKSK